ncbi:AFG1/ZapE family ATPase [Serratia ureilytica]
MNDQTRATGSDVRQTGGQGGEEAPVLQINHRPLQAIRSVDGVLAVDFHTLCEEARSQLDYIALSRLYHSVILYNVQVMGPLKENTARRFRRWWTNSTSGTSSW